MIILLGIRLANNTNVPKQQQNQVITAVTGQYNRLLATETLLSP